MEETQEPATIEQRRTIRTRTLFGMILKRWAMELLNPKSETDAATETKSLVITDADGTLWSFWDYFVPAMRVVIPEIGATLSEKCGRKVTMDEVSHEFGRVMKRRGTHEYPWVCEESMFWQDPEWRKLWTSYQEFRDEVVAPFWTAMDQARLRYMHLFDDVRETLLTLRAHGKDVVILTDAPYYMARARVTQLGVDDLLTAVYALETPEPPAEVGLSDEELEYGRDRVRQFSSVASRCPMHAMPVDWEKPSPKGMARILLDLNVESNEAVMVGDSLKKDGGVAQANNVAYIWARYGVHLPTEYRKMIDVHFVHPSDRPTASKKTVYPPMLGKYGAASWSVVLDHLGPEPLPLQPTVLNPSVHTAPVESAGH